MGFLSWFKRSAPDNRTLAPGELESAFYALSAEQRAILESSVIPVSPAQLDIAWGLGPTRSGVQINERTALTYTAVYAATKILAEALAMLPLKVYDGDEDSNEHQVASRHPIYPLLRLEPNPEMTAATFKETLQAHLCLWGNAYARIVLNGAGRPVQLLPLQPDKTRAERIAGRLTYTVEQGGSFAPEEIIHIPGLGYNGIQGLSPIAMARETIALGKAAELFGATFFGNGANLGGVLQYQGILKPEQKNAIRQAWATMHEGVGNANRTAVLDGGAKYERIGIPPEDAQFLQTRQFQVIDVARLYRIPPHMLGELTKAGYASIEQQSLEFLLYTLTPWITKWEQELTRKLFGSGSGFFAKFDTKQLMRADHTARQNYYASGRQWGYLSANDIRAMEDLPPIQNGDIYLQPVNMQGANAQGKPGVDPDKPGDNIQPGPNPDSRAAEDEAREMLCRAMSLRPVFEDAIARMLRKEQNAAKRSGGTAKPEFYERHAEDVRESLTPASSALFAVMGMNDARDAIAEALREPSAKRHGVDIDVAATAADEAEHLMSALIQRCRGKQ